MRRTRRRWGWVVVGVAMLVGSWHGFQTRQAVARRGWIAGAPGPVLVAPVAWMSTTPGSALADGPEAASGFEFTVGRELVARRERIGWLGRRVLVLIGRASSAEALTDGTAMKGAVFRTVMPRLYRAELLTASEARWARSVVWASFETRDGWRAGATAHGRLRTRALLGGPYRVDVVNVPGRFEVFGTDPSEWSPLTARAVAGGGPPFSPRSARHGDGAWDPIQPVRDGSWIGQRDTVVPMLRDEYPGAPEGAWMGVLFESADGQDPYVGPGRRLGMVEVFVPLRLAADAAPAPVDDAATGRWLGSSLRARLMPARPGGRGAWRPVVALRWEGAHRGEAVTFGGGVSVVWKGADGSEAVLLGGEGCWFRAEPSAGRVVARASGLLWPGEWAAASVSDASVKAWVDGAAGGRLVVRIGPGAGPLGASVYADLDADRVYLGVVEVELEGWTVEEVNRLRLSGVWPDHALRE